MRIPAVRVFAMGCVLALVLGGAVAARAQSSAAATLRDGHADFNFLLGTWRTRYRRLRRPLSHSHDWYDCGGTAHVRPFWNGSANLEDGDLQCPAQHVIGMTLRLYNATTHQWSLYWGNKSTGLSIPPQVGHFTNGVGDFYCADTFAGRPIVVRYRWTRKPGNHPHFEQAFSGDRGRTWETNWTTDYTRI